MFLCSLCPLTARCYAAAAIRPLYEQ